MNISSNNNCINSINDTSSHSLISVNTSRCSLNLLPPEVLRTCFEWIPMAKMKHVSCVNKEWRLLVKNELRQRLSQLFDEKDINKAAEFFPGSESKNFTQKIKNWFRALVNPGQYEVRICNFKINQFNPPQLDKFAIFSINQGYLKSASTVVMKLLAEKLEPPVEGDAEANGSKNLTLNEGIEALKPIDFKRLIYQYIDEDRCGELDGTILLSNSYSVNVMQKNLEDQIVSYAKRTYANMGDRVDISQTRKIIRALIIAVLWPKKNYLYREDHDLREKMEECFKTMLNDAIERDNFTEILEVIQEVVFQEVSKSLEFIKITDDEYVELYRQHQENCEAAAYTVICTPLVLLNRTELAQNIIKKVFRKRSGNIIYKEIVRSLIKKDQAELALAFANSIPEEIARNDALSEAMNLFFDNAIPYHALVIKALESLPCTEVIKFTQDFTKKPLLVKRNDLLRNIIYSFLKIKKIEESLMIVKKMIAFEQEKGDSFLTICRAWKFIIDSVQDHQHLLTCKAAYNELPEETDNDKIVKDEVARILSNALDRLSINTSD